MLFLRTQSKLVRDIVLNVVRRSGLYARSEIVLQAMISSQCLKFSGEAVQIIRRMRGTAFDENQLGVCSLKQRKCSQLNICDTKKSKVCDLSSEVLEPPLTISMTKKDLKSFKYTLVQVLDLPSHTHKFTCKPIRPTMS